MPLARDLYKADICNTHGSTVSKLPILAVAGAQFNLHVKTSPLNFSRSIFYMGEIVIKVGKLPFGFMPQCATGV